MEERLLDFIKSLKLDKSIESFDEAATKQEIILQCLHILGWNTFNVDEVHPEYSVGKDKVDYLLRYNTPIFYDYGGVSRCALDGQI